MEMPLIFAYSIGVGLMGAFQDIQDVDLSGDERQNAHMTIALMWPLLIPVAVCYYAWTKLNGNRKA